MTTESILANAVAGSAKKAMGAAGAKSQDLWMVHPSKLHIDPGFNVRDRGEDYEAQVSYLTDRIVTSGFDKTCPLAGYVVRGEDGEDRVYIYDGHRRLEATNRAIEQGAEIEAVPVIVAPAGTSAEDLVVSLVTKNSGQPLKPIEVAAVVKRLLAFGMDERTVASRLGYTSEYVKNLLDLLAAPKAIREMVRADKVSATEAVKLVRKHGKEATGLLKGALKEAEAKGKTKATGKHVKAVVAKAVKASAPKPEASVSEPTGSTAPADDTMAVMRELAEAVRACRVGDDYADLLARADVLTGADDGGL